MSPILNRTLRDAAHLGLHQSHTNRRECFMPQAAHFCRQR